MARNRVAAGLMLLVSGISRVHGAFSCSRNGGFSVPYNGFVLCCSTEDCEGADGGSRQVTRSNNYCDEVETIPCTLEGYPDCFPSYNDDDTSSDPPRDVFYLVGDGDCDNFFNKKDCGYDHGDCCDESCCDEARCGTNRSGFNCIDKEPWNSGCGNGVAPTPAPFAPGEEFSCRGEGATLVPFQGFTLCCADFYCGGDEDDDGEREKEDLLHRDNYCNDTREIPCIAKGYPECTGAHSRVGNGECNGGNNNEACGWDHGDCCEETCCPDQDERCGPFNCKDPNPEANPRVCSGAPPTPTPADEGEVFSCSEAGGMLVPFRAFVFCCTTPGCGPDGRGPTAMSDNYCDVTRPLPCILEGYYPDCPNYARLYLGDGNCDRYDFNTEACGWDGGDCCESSCCDGGFGDECEDGNFECLDPMPWNTGCGTAECESDDDCDTANGEICCATKKQCEVPLEGTDPSACGDPHMTGFLGQKFDFTGVDGEWYCLIKDSHIQVSMRVTSPVASVPEITYITGLSVLTVDADGSEHDIVIEVTNPHSLESWCPEDVTPCLADGSLRVLLDGEEELRAPGSVMLGPDVMVSAVNLPGECRSFGFETYWERKKMEDASHGRRLANKKIDMGTWILGDPTATNMEECTQYVASAAMDPGALFAHQSEHATFQILTPQATIRLSHGRLHQVAMRDPTDQFDLPDHVTWQMNMGVDHNDISRTATGILGETFVPTLDSAGNRIMVGMESIRGTQEEYRLEGPLASTFARDS